MIQRALVSVADKTGIVPFAAALAARGVALISTGGTARALTAAGLPVTEVAEVTGFPEMLDGRVKTLHPAIHAALLARRDQPDDLATLAARGIAPIDLVLCNLYPFTQTVASGASAADCIENIDIAVYAILLDHEHLVASGQHGIDLGGGQVVEEFPAPFDGRMRRG